MPVIRLTTIINAPVERCFDLSRSIEFHQYTTSKTNEKAIAGITKGLINKGQTVTWKAKHFGVAQQLSVEISAMERPNSFEDRMIKGAFKSMKHQHYFEQKGIQTIMNDVFEFESPAGIIGKLFNRFILTNYMKQFLEERNRLIKSVAESEKWKKYLTA